MKNPIPQNHMWATPENPSDLAERLGNFTGKEEAAAWHGAMLAINMCRKLVEDQLTKEENENE